LHALAKDFIRMISETPNKITGANAGGGPRLVIRALGAARIAQFFR
jgi:hypothetical protein